MNKRTFALLAGVASLLFAQEASAAQVCLTTAGPGSMPTNTLLPGYNGGPITVVAWGAGGDGVTPTATFNSYGGGSGATCWGTVTPASTAYWNVGTHNGPSNTTGASWFGGSTLPASQVGCKGGVFQSGAPAGSSNGLNNTAIQAGANAGSGGTGITTRGGSGGAGGGGFIVATNTLVPSIPGGNNGVNVGGAGGAADGGTTGGGAAPSGAGSAGTSFSCGGGGGGGGGGNNSGSLNGGNAGGWGAGGGGAFNTGTPGIGSNGAIVITYSTTPIVSGGSFLLLGVGY